MMQTTQGIGTTGSSRDAQCREQGHGCVWLIEDDSDVRNLMAGLLRSEGFEVVELADGMEALNHLAAADVFSADVKSPDMVVADIVMPNFSGLDVLMGMRESRLSPPVMFVTGVADDELRREARRLGAVEVISKPFGVDTFLSAVDQTLAAGEAHSDGAKMVEADSEKPPVATDLDG